MNLDLNGEVLKSLVLDPDMVVSPNIEFRSGGKLYMIGTINGKWTFSAINVVAGTLKLSVTLENASTNAYSLYSNI